MSPPARTRGRRRAVAAAVLGGLVLLLASCAAPPEVPPRLYRELVAAPAPPPPEAPESEEWDAALARLEALRSSSEAAAGRAAPRWLADPRRLEALRPAAGDAAAALASLRGDFSLADVEALALLRSPAVLAAERAHRGALEGYGQVAALDEVLRQYAAVATGLMPGVGGGAMGDSPRERFPFPGMLALKGQVVAQEAAIAFEDLQAARRGALAEARRVYWDLHANRRTAALTEELSSLAGDIERAARARYESGAGDFQGVVQAQVFAERTGTELPTLREQRRALEAALRALLVLPADARLGGPLGDERLTPPPPPGTLAAQAREHRQELRAMRAEAAKMELMIAMAEREIIPGFTGNLSLFENRPLLQAGTAAMAEAFAVTGPAGEGAGLPLRPWFGRAASYLRETRERLGALRERIRGEEEMTEARVRAVWFALDRALREEELVRVRIVALQRLARESAERTYRAGKQNLAAVLEATRRWRESEIEAVRLRAEVGRGWAALEEAVGAPVAGLPPAGG